MLEEFVRRFSMSCGRLRLGEGDLRPVETHLLQYINAIHAVR